MNIVLDFLVLLIIIIYSYLESLVKVFIPRKRKSVAGEIVLITGAGHGIGRHTAYEFAKRKSRLVLWDINKVMNSCAHLLKVQVRQVFKFSFSFAYFCIFLGLYICCALGWFDEGNKPN